MRSGRCHGWYKLAEANGLAGDEGLIEGTTLNIPAGVMRNTYTASTFTPYDPNDTIGNTSPTAPKFARKGPGCDAIGQIIIALVAVAIFIIAQPLAADMFGGGMVGGILGGAAAGATSSVISQAGAVATGVQDKFSWGAVGLAALAGGVGGALNAGGPLAGDGFVQTVGRAVASNVVTQGVGVLTHMQDNFSWANVAAAAVGAAVGWGVSQLLPGAAFDKIGPKGPMHVPAQYGNAAISGGAGLIAQTATRSLIEGSDFGDNMMAALPDFFSQTAGALFGEYVNGASGNIVAQKEADAAAIIKPEPVTPIEQLPITQIELMDLPVLRHIQIATEATHSAPSLQADPNTDISGVGYMGPDYGGFLAWRLPTGNGDLLHDFANLVRNNRSTIGAGVQAAGGIEGQLFNWLPDTEFTRDLSAVLHDMNEGWNNWLNQAPLDAQTRRDLRDVAPLAAAGGVTLLHGRGLTREVLGEVGALERSSLAAARAVRSADATGYDLILTYMPDWTAAQRAAADVKVAALNGADTTVTRVQRSGSSASAMYRREGGLIPSGSDVDHVVDLQLGGSNTASNLLPLNSSVNRSLGAQIGNLVRNMPAGTHINRVTILPRSG